LIKVVILDINEEPDNAFVKTLGTINFDELCAEEYVASLTEGLETIPIDTIIVKKNPNIWKLIGQTVFLHFDKHIVQRLKGELDNE
jgi:hypothetical protein